MDAWGGLLQREYDEMPAHSRGFASLYRAEGAALTYGPNLPRGMANRMIKDLDNAEDDLSSRERYRLRGAGLRQYFASLGGGKGTGCATPAMMLDEVVEELQDSREILNRLLADGSLLGGNAGRDREAREHEESVARRQELLEPLAVLAALRGQIHALAGETEARADSETLAVEVAKSSGLNARRVVSRIQALTRMAVDGAKAASVVAALLLTVLIGTPTAHAADTSNSAGFVPADTSNSGGAPSMADTSNSGFTPWTADTSNQPTL